MDIYANILIATLLPALMTIVFMILEKKTFFNNDFGENKVSIFRNYSFNLTSKLFELDSTFNSTINVFLSLNSNGDLLEHHTIEMSGIDNYGDLIITDSVFSSNKALSAAVINNIEGTGTISRKCISLVQR